MAALFVESGARIAAAVNPSHFALQKDNFDYRWNTVDNVLLQHNGPQLLPGAAIVVPQSIVIEENSVK